MSDAETVLRRYFDALNKRDYDAVAGAFADDCEYVSVASGARFSGPASVVHGLREFSEAFPDWRVELGAVISSPTIVAAEWRTSGTQDGLFRGRPATGFRFRRDGCAVAEVADGRITRYRDYYDRVTLLEQLGLAPVL